LRSPGRAQLSLYLNDKPRRQIFCRSELGELTVCAVKSLNLAWRQSIKQLALDEGAPHSCSVARVNRRYRLLLRPLDQDLAETMSQKAECQSFRINERPRSRSYQIAEAAFVSRGKRKGRPARRPLDVIQNGRRLIGGSGGCCNERSKAAIASPSFRNFRWTTRATTSCKVICVFSIVTHRRCSNQRIGRHSGMPPWSGCRVPGPGNIDADQSVRFCRVCQAAIPR